MRVLVTGTIAGLPEVEYFHALIGMAGFEGIPFEYYDLVEALEATGGKKLYRLLGATNYLFEVLREREYRKIGFRMEQRHTKNAVIRVPATIQWDGINVKLKDLKEIAEYVRPDVVVTLIDSEWDIVSRIMATENNPICDNIKKAGCDHTAVLTWTGEEVSLSEDWAKAMGIRHYVIPVNQHPLSLYKLVRHASVPSFYVSYSMTHADESIRSVINSTVKRLCGFGLVIDPQAIEIPKAPLSDRDRRITRAFTVHRDLHMFVGKVDAVVAIHPYDDRPPLSTGMMDELGHARDYFKERYMIFPGGRSPFTTNSYIEESHVFADAESFFEHLALRHGYEPLNFPEELKDVPWDANPLKQKTEEEPCRQFP